jgi:hypothetical protein
VVKYHQFSWRVLEAHATGSPSVSKKSSSVAAATKSAVTLAGEILLAAIECGKLYHHPYGIEI